MLNIFHLKFNIQHSKYAVMVATENSIYVSEKAKKKVHQLMEEAGVTGDDSYFLRVGVVGGGC